MSTLKQFFGTRPSEDLHPTARSWLERVRAGQKATVTLWRKRDGLIYKPAKIYVNFETPGGRVREHEDWDVDIDEPLMLEGVPAEDESNEAQRMSLMLRHWFSEAEERYGAGYFEAVLVEDLRGSEFVSDKRFADLLREIHVNQPSQSRSYHECVKAIDATLARAAQILTQNLKYPEATAKQILTAALAQYLDERFHITSRKMLGWR